MSGIKTIYVDSLACLRVKEGERKRFRIGSRMRDRGVSSLFIFSMHI